MRIAVFHGADAATPISVDRAPDPAPGPGQVVVDIARSGICASDLSMTSGSDHDYRPGMPLGHEYAGEVVALGRDVRDLRVGARVAVLPVAGCGECPECATAAEARCRRRTSFVGGLADYIAVDERNAVPLPEAVSVAEGALIEPFAVGLHALRAAGHRPGDRIVVLGAGSVATTIVYWARILGAGHVVVAGRSERGQDRALAAGADLACSLEELRASAHPALIGSADIVVECIGHRGVLDLAADLARPGGTVVLLGLGSETESLVPARWGFKELRLVFPLAYTRQEFHDTARAFVSHAVPLAPLISDVIGLSEVPAALAELRCGSRRPKVQVEPRLDRHRSTTEKGLPHAGS